MQSILPLFDAFDARILAVHYEWARQSVRAHVSFTIAVERYVEDEHDALARRFDDLEDVDWHMQMLDADEGPKLAWFDFVIEARSVEACRWLHSRTSAVPAWFMDREDGHA